MDSIASSQPDQRHIRLITASAQAKEAVVRDILHEESSWTTHNDRDALRVSLQKIAPRGNLNIVRLLLEYGAETNPRRDNEVPALIKAAEGGHAVVVQELLLHKADPNLKRTKGHSALITACLRGHNDVVKALLDGGADITARDKEARTPLLFLASEKPGKWNNETLKLLLAKGADIEVRDPTGRTPLLWAATNGNLRLVDALLSGELGRIADISAANNRGRSALHLAAESNHVEMVKLLLKHNADVGVTSDGGWTALHNAAQSGHAEVVGLLLQANSNVNRELSNGMTPLHWAAFNGHEEVVKLLLTKPDANLSIKDGFDRTPLLCAAEKYHKNIVQLLSLDQGGERLLPFAQKACREFEATVVDFGHFRDGKRQLVFKHSIYDLLYGWDVDEQTKVKKPKVPTLTKNIKYEPSFRWIHLPANNIAWVETLLSKHFVEGGHRDIEAFKALEKCFDLEHRGPMAHAHFMRTFAHRISPPQGQAVEKEEKSLAALSEDPSEMSTVSSQVGSEVTPKKPQDHGENGIPKSDGKKKGKAEQLADRHPKRAKRTSGPPGNPPGTKAAKALARSATQSSVELARLPPSNGKFILFMPFLHYETDQRRQEMSHAIDSVRKGRPLPENPSRDVMLVNAYMKSTPPLHPRRTLDQFFYHGIDTSNRDLDQVVYRYCKRHHIEKKVFMVDQLWLWVLGRDLVITCFPQRWNQPKRDPLNVLDGIIEETNAKTRPPIQSVYDLAMLIISRCSGMFDRHRLDDQDYQFLDMFESSIGLVTNKESELFERFNLASVQSAEWLRQHWRRRRPRNRDGVKLHVFPDALLDIGAETRLLAEIKDIRDELNIIAVILSNQMSILEEFENNITDEFRIEGNRRATEALMWETRRRSREQKRLLETHRKDIDRMDRQAESIYMSLTHLLDLKQKHSNALEARFARDHAVIAARQGQTIMVFTIVTILFLPMSVIAAFFAINLEEWNGLLSIGYVSKYMFGIGLGISIPMIAMAFAAPDIVESVKSGFGRLFHGQHGGQDDQQEESEKQDVEPDLVDLKKARASHSRDRAKWGASMSPRLSPSYDHEHRYGGLSPDSARRDSATRKFSIGSGWARPSYERPRAGIGDDLERGRAGSSGVKY